MRIERLKPNKFIGYDNSPTGFGDNEWAIVDNDQKFIQGKDGKIYKFRNHRQAYAVMRRLEVDRLVKEKTGKKLNEILKEQNNAEIKKSE